jgi:hypothetical protein
VKKSHRDGDGVTGTGGSSRSSHRSSKGSPKKTEPAHYKAHKGMGHHPPLPPKSAPRF